MQLVLYKDDYTVVSLVKPVNNLVINDKDIMYDGGSMCGVNANFGVFPDTLTVNIGDTLTPDQLSQALKTDFSPESQQHDNRIANLELTVISLMNKLAGV